MNEHKSQFSPPADGTKPIRVPRELPAVGQTLSWGTLGGDRYEGVVVEMDSNVAVVLLPDGTKKAVEC